MVNYVYKATPPDEAAVHPGKPVLKPLASFTALPPDVAWTTTSTGQRVPYVVCIETGTKLELGRGRHRDANRRVGQPRGLLIGVKISRQCALIKLPRD